MGSILAFIFEEVQKRSMVYAATAPSAPVSVGRASGQVQVAGGRATIITRTWLGSDAGLYGAVAVANVRN